MNTRIIALIIFILITNRINADWKNSIRSTDEMLDKKEYASALIFAEQSLKFASDEFGERSLYYAQSLSKIGEVHYLSGKFETAIDYFYRSKELYFAISGKDEPAYARIINNISVIYQHLGKFYEAEPYLLESIELKRAQGLQGDISYSKSLNNLAQMYIELGRFNDAEPLLLESLDIKKKQEGKESESYGMSLLNLGILYKKLGNNNEAINNLEKAFAIMSKKRGESDTETNKARLALALSYISVDKKNEAKKLLEQHNNVNAKGEGKNHPEYAGSLYNLALLKWSLEQPDEAKKLLYETMEIVEKTFGNGYPLFSSCLNSLAVIYWTEGNIQKAEEYIRNALNIRKQVLGEKHPDYATTLHNLAGICKDLGRFKEADQYYKNAFELYLEHIDNYFPFLSEDEKSRFFASLKEKFEMFNCYVITRYDENPELIGEMYNLQLATKAILLNSSVKVREQIMKSGDRELILKYQLWRGLRERLSKIFSLSKREIQSSGYNISAIEDSINNLEKDLSRFSLSFQNEYSKKRSDWKDIQRKLKNHEAAVEIVRFRFFESGTSRNIYYAALILTSETKDSPKLVLIKNGNQLEELYIKNYLNSINLRINDKDSYKAFWQPVEEQLGTKKVIYFSPDGVYQKINLNTILRPDGRYIIDDRTIKILTNTDDLLSQTKQKTNARNSAVLMGYPNYYTDLEELNPGIIVLSSSSNQVSKEKIVITELPGTKAEVEAVGKILSDKKWSVSSYLGNNATENALKLQESPYLLHIATHGYFLRDLDIKYRQRAFGVDMELAAENPLLRSGILLSGCVNTLAGTKQFGGDYENGILFSYEAMNLNLDNTQLVILSACETGLGEIKNGEGVYGLQRAFRVAGANNLLMTLWKIDDQASQDLMVEFYRQFTSGKNFVEALKTAQLKMKEKYPHPYFWGSFLMVGAD